ncbi:hypothetical protein NEUTE1DRAFT_47907 [Neurospora tetrasperma FGSC 2508]|uniref:Uncharacterized protein n=1 Tax=Neurospora tetrasperma (strain FGSC 2508 / ATCC MYA-4615 / P0657) TaxID=510951 RepID=F8MT50_NEUT8|nr:uncharacterized protein NEUTE1DRAFT_47907 [Neurospora tetrasperma FGSC 2508]EGO55182.1 hypothetical protein NEUTE1DRAFT_47907 [Neurospora tetrasperma FGSC 2508]EGZ69602.1 hypothetical protein NEUTE2DRAFT_72238 [Neurospora tetrasperma FGSC 2509]
MSSSMQNPAKEIISMIERLDGHPHGLHADKRFGYAVGLVGCALQKGYTKHGLKRIICDYEVSQRQELALVKSDVQIKNISRRELLCRDVLDIIIELENNDRSREQAKANNIAAWNKDVVVANGFAVHNDNQPVTDKNLVVNEDNVDTLDFVHITGSDVECSEEDASDWELV